MKRIIALFGMVCIFGLLAGCGQQDIPVDVVDVVVDAETGDVIDVENQDDSDQSDSVADQTTVLTVDVDESMLEWSAKRVLYGYTGVVYFQEGTVTVENGMPVGGSFVLDMTNFTLNGPERAKNAIMENMFEVERYPESVLVIQSVEPASSSDTFTITADLTIKDTTNEIVFSATFTPDRRSATAFFSIDRTRRGLNYQSASVFSGLGDKAISDTIAFDVDLSFE